MAYRKTSKRGRPLRVMAEAPSSPEALAPPAPPMPVAKPAEPSTLERVCAHLGITLRDVKRFEDGGQDLELVTKAGVRHRVDLADLR